MRRIMPQSINTFTSSIACPVVIGGTLLAIGSSVSFITYCGWTTRTALSTDEKLDHYQTNKQRLDHFVTEKDLKLKGDKHSAGKYHECVAGLLVRY